jgi:hypothetical protein
LYGLGVPAETAKILLRHSAVAVTKQHYIKLKPAKEGRGAMNKLEKRLPKVGHWWAEENADNRREVELARMKYV